MHSKMYLKLKTVYYSNHDIKKYKLNSNNAIDKGIYRQFYVYGLWMHIRNTIKANEIIYKSSVHINRSK